MNAESQKTLVNDIYRGRVVNLEPAIGAAFIDFGQGRNGFLHTSDVLPVYGEDDFRIDDLLKAGIHDEEGDHDADWSEEADALDDIAEEIADVDDLEDEDQRTARLTRSLRGLRRAAQEEQAEEIAQGGQEGRTADEQPPSDRSRRRGRAAARRG